MNIHAGKVLAFLLTSLFSIAVFALVAEKIAGNTGEICVTPGSSKLCFEYFSLNELIGFKSFVKKKEQKLEQGRVAAEQLAAEQDLLLAMKSLEDTLRVLATFADRDLARFWLPKNDRNYWFEIFSHWEKLQENQELYRILHHGDSQIEMDRITAIIRKNLQQKFGGSGPGLVPPLQLIPSYTVQQSASENWKRYISYGIAVDRAPHNHYGALGMIFNFDSGYAHLNISTRIKKDSTLNRFESVKIVTGRLDSPLKISVTGRNIQQSTTVNPSDKEQMVQWALPGSSSGVNVAFTGDSTSNILGIAIDGTYGIAMDNIPWRGSSGLTFTGISKTSLSNTYRLLEVKMVIMQFGGNSVPYIKDEKAVHNYVNGFKKQIDHIKSIDSTIKILVIGPADMSHNNKGEMVTYPLLEDINTGMRKVSVESGAAFWSMYDAMGGKNSMTKWVNAFPALGAPDYIHFTQKGAEVIAEKFYSAIEREYQIYKKKIELDERKSN